MKIPGGFRWIEFPIYLYIFSIPFTGVEISTNLSIARIAAIGAFVSFAFVRITQGAKPSFSVNRIDVWVLLYLFSNLVTYFWAADEDHALFYIGVLAQLVMMYLIISKTFTSPKKIELLMHFFLAGCVVSVPMVLLFSQPDPTASSRFAGAAGDANKLALAMLMVLPFAVFKFFDARSIMVKVPYLACTLILVTTTILTGSRGGLIALSLSVAVFILKANSLGLKISLAILVLVSGIFMLPRLSDENLSRLLTFSANKESGNSLAIRMKNYVAGPQMFLDHPFGVGTRNFEIASSDYDVIEKRFVAHSTIIEIATGSGIAGLLCAALVFLMTPVQLSRRLAGAANLKSALLLGLASQIIVSLFISADLEKVFLLFPAIASGLMNPASLKEIT